MANEINILIEEFNENIEPVDKMTTEEFKKVVSSAGFIENMYSFIYDRVIEITDQQINEFLRIIIEHNKEIVNAINYEKNQLLNFINRVPKNNAETISSVSENIVPEKKDSENKVEYLDLTSDVERLLNYEKKEEVISSIIKTSPEKIPSLKFAIFKMIKKIEAEIKKVLLHNSTTSVANLQKQIKEYREILVLINNKENELEIEEISFEDSKYNLIIAPNLKNGTYLYDDISQFPEQFKEIKNSIDKISSLYFLSTHDNKSLTGEYDKVSEYKHPNGIRIMYIKEGNNIIVTSLFYKDKQKSTKIDLYYEEAINRYMRCKQYIFDNINNPNFIIEQKELLGEIFSLLESRTLKR